MKIPRVYSCWLIMGLHLLSHMLYSDGLGFRFTRQDFLRLKLSRLKKIEVIDKRHCCDVINKWKLENNDDQEYRILLDQGMRQICNDDAFPLLVNETNAEYIIINLVSNNNVNILNILENKQNNVSIDESLLTYHKYLVENDYNPSYYELKTNNMNQFLNVVFLNLLDGAENDMIRMKKKNYMKYLEQNTKNKYKRENETKRKTSYKPNDTPNDTPNDKTNNHTGSCRDEGLTIGDISTIYSEESAIDDGGDDDKPNDKSNP